MARNLVAAGHEVVACDLDPARAEALGGSVAATPAEAAAGADLAITSLPSPEAVEHVAGELPADAFFVDMSTGPPALARRLAERFEAALDAPVSGGPRGARSGKLATHPWGAAMTYDELRTAGDAKGAGMDFFLEGAALLLGQP